MKKLFAFLLSFICSTTVFSATGDTTVIVAHTLSNLNSPPSNDDIWVSFPDNSTSYQKVILKFTLGCGTPNCSGWDYTVNTAIGKLNGAIDSAIVSIDSITHDTVWNYWDHVEYMELGRLITPYGTYMANNSNGFNSSWTHPYYYDVTDYESFLKDSVSVRVHYDGWSDAFSARIEFLMIEGPPTRMVESVREIYDGGYGYANSTDFENAVSAQTFYIAPSVTSAKVSVIMTGHGQQGEFDPHNIHVKVNSATVYSHLLWKDDCGLNAVAPQGGTWIFNRANWCPGEKVPMYEVDITPYITPGQNVTVDLDMDDFVQTQGASYGISAHLITYTGQKNNDVMLEEIIAPNLEKPYLRFNPISTKPIVKIKNMGKQALTYAEISYWINGGNKAYYEWTGNLLPFESTTVTLPAFDWFGLDTTNRRFYAEAKWPSDVPDEYELNNALQSSFNMTPKHDSLFYIYFKANNQPWENSYVVTNENGDTISYKNTFTAGAIHRDTMRLPEGSYSFDFYDYDSLNWGCGDGIQFWLNQQSSSDPWYETTGLLRLYRMNNSVLKNFSGDFGSKVHYEFTVGYPLGYNPPKDPQTPPVHNTGIAEVESAINLNIFPNPARELLQVQVDMNKATSGQFIITDVLGKQMYSHNLSSSPHTQFSVALNQFSKGVYVATVFANGNRYTKKVFVE